MPATTKPRAPRPFSCQLVRMPIWPCELLPHGYPGEVVINGVVYALEVIGRLPEVGEPVTDGFRLTNQANGQVYDIDPKAPGGPSCECGSFVFRMANERDGCKHTKALREFGLIS